MTPLRQRMTEDMAIRNLSARTQLSYIGQVKRFARHFRTSPDRLGPAQIRDYQLFLSTEKRLSPRLDRHCGLRPALPLSRHPP